MVDVLLCVYIISEGRMYATCMRFHMAVQFLLKCKYWADKIIKYVNSLNHIKINLNDSLNQILRFLILTNSIPHPILHPPSPHLCDHRTASTPTKKKYVLNRFTTALPTGANKDPDSTSETKSSSAQHCLQSKK